MKRIFLLFGCCLVFMVLSGCASKPSSIIASTSPLPPGVRGTIPARGSDCQYSLLGLFPFTTSPSTARALRSAKEDADVDVLTDVTVDHNAGYYLLFSNNCVRIEGLGVPKDLLRRRNRLAGSIYPDY